MSNQNDDLKNMCQDLYALEKEARDIYEVFLKDITDEHERDVISHIKSDEEHHMKIAQEMLKIAEGE